MAREQLSTEQVQEILGPMPRITPKLEGVGTPDGRWFSKVGKDCWEEWESTRDAKQP